MPIIHYSQQRLSPPFTLAFGLLGPSGQHTTVNIFLYTGMPSPARLSIDSQSSRHSDTSSPSSSSDRSDRSTTALILVNDGDQEDNSFAIADDEEEIPDSVSTQGDDLSPSVAFGYFLSPHLKLGSMLILSSQAPLKLSIPALLVFAFLSAFSRQIWFLLARYVRPDLNEIVAEALTQGRGRERQRSITKGVTRFLSAVMRILLATVYLKGEFASVYAHLTSLMTSSKAQLAVLILFGPSICILFLRPSLWLSSSCS